MASAQMRLETLGSTGLKESSGFIQEEFLIRLRGRNGIRLYREMSENNSIVGAILFIIDMIVRQVAWRIQTPEGMEENPTALREKEFIEGCMNDMSHTWEDFISEVLTMLVFGWQFNEIVYKLRKGDTRNPKTRSKFTDGRWGWRKIEPRSQDTLWRWLFDIEGGLDGMIQQDIYRPTGGNVVLPIEKSILFRTRSIKGSPEGRSLLRPAVRSWFFLKRIQEIEAVGIERDLAGMPIMEVPREVLLEDAEPADRAIRTALETMIQQIRVDERWGGLIPTELDREGKPTGFKFRLQTTGGRRMINTNDIIRRYESRIAMVFMAEFIMIGMDKVGTESLHEGKSSMFKLALETILTDMIASPFNRFGIGRLMSLNRVPQEFWPILTPPALDSPDLEKMGIFIQSLATAGVLSPNKPLEAKLLADAKLPPPPEEDEEIFADPDMPTPRDTPDQQAGVLSPSQIDAIMSINRAIKKRELTIDAAKELAAASLGMDPGAVERFLIAEPPPPTLAPPLPPQVVPGGNVAPPGSVPSDDDLPPDPRSTEIDGAK
jgi:hypothetical protein